MKKNTVIAIILVFLGVILFLLFLANKQDQEVRAEIAFLEGNRELLMADFEGTDTGKRIAALKYLRHDQSLWPELERILMESGNEDLAIAFVNIGDGHATIKHIDPIYLKNAGISWAEAHGYKVMRWVRGIEQGVYLTRDDGQ